MDYAKEFAGLMDHFAREYRRGRTPNPCVMCNQELKFGHLFSMAEGLGAEAVATGHYARQVDGRLYRPVDRAKDQTYYLFGVQREALGRSLFPLGDLTKDQVRERARSAGLVTADKPESMEICFVTSGDYRDVVRDRGGRGRAGRFLDGSGKVLGTHDGLDGFTVGQRRGLPALGVRHYVKEIRESGDVVVGTASALQGQEAILRGVNWLVEPPGPGGLDAEVQVRARSEPVSARLLPLPEGPEVVRAEFATSVFAISPGQAGVFYDGDLVLGGGWLD